MYKNKKFLAIIPARGGSKGLPNKNILSLDGKPVLSYTIESAKSSKYIDEIFLSTDSIDIAAVAKDFGCDIKELRPDHLARDDSKTSDLIDYTLDYYQKRNQEFDYIILLEPTSPLRKKADIDNAIEMLDENSDGVISVGKIGLEHPDIVKRIEQGKIFSYIAKENTAHQRQMLSDAYFPYGVIYIIKTKIFKEKKTFYSDNVIPYFIERWQNYEIDDLCDFVCIESIIKAKKRGLL